MKLILDTSKSFHLDKFAPKLVFCMHHTTPGESDTEWLVTCLTALNLVALPHSNNIFLFGRNQSKTSGQSFKASMLVNYISRVIPDKEIVYITTLDS